MPNLMVALPNILPNIGGALCSTLQYLAISHKRCKIGT